MSKEDNINLIVLPTEDEIKNTIFSLSAESSAGPDGYNGTFFQSCWDIIKYDIIAFVMKFFRGKPLTKFFSHSYLVLIPKVDTPSSFSEFRPISLTNFTNKVISKILALRLNPLLPSLISENQSGFVKDRLITENVQLAQEIIHSISQPNTGGNVVIKLDMDKTYDRMSSHFVTSVLQKFGFSEDWVDMILRLISNSWYSIIVNGIRTSFFTSSQGLKQGGPLSPSLFIIAAEVLSRSLNMLHSYDNFIPFSMSLNGPLINHLAYADDIVIFSSGSHRSIKLIMHQIKKYEQSSGQMVNKEKCFFLTAPKT